MVVFVGPGRADPSTATVWPVPQSSREPWLASASSAVLSVRNTRHLGLPACAAFAREALSTHPLVYCQSGQVSGGKNQPPPAVPTNSHSYFQPMHIFCVLPPLSRPACMHVAAAVTDTWW